MKICKQTAKLLFTFNKFVKHKNLKKELLKREFIKKEELEKESKYWFLLKAPSRFFCISEDKIIAEGTIWESVKEDTIFHLPKSLKDTELLIWDKLNHSQLELINNLKVLNKDSRIASFELDNESVKFLKKANRKLKLKDHIKLTHVDDEVILETCTNNKEVELVSYVKNFSGIKFNAQITNSNISKIVDDSYEITLLKNDFLIFEGYETGFTYYIKYTKLYS